MRRALIVLLSIAAALAADKDKPRFAPGKAAASPGHQTQDKITVAAIPYITAEQSATVFGKAKPYQEGILPVLVIIDNGTGRALRLDLAAQFQDTNGHHLEAVSPQYVMTYHAITKRPGAPRTSPLPPIPRSTQKKGPLNTPEIENRALSIKLVPPGETVYGFFYFEASYVPGSTLYLKGFSDAASGNEYLFFEVPIQKQ
jgi:hypothetical protein